MANEDKKDFNAMLHDSKDRKSALAKIKQYLEGKADDEHR